MVFRPLEIADLKLKINEIIKGEICTDKKEWIIYGDSFFDSIICLANTEATAMMAHLFCSNPPHHL